MPLRYLIWFLILSVVAAQSIQGSIPSCAAQCMSNQNVQSQCSVGNVSCICNNTDAFHAVEKCVMASCSVRDALTTKNITETACGVPVRDQSRIIVQLAPTMAALALVFVLIRITARWHQLGMDDGCICFAWLNGLVLSILNVRMTNYGLGKDVWRVPFDDLTHMLYLFYILSPFYLAAIVFTKIGLCLFLLHIFPFREFRLTTWVTIGVCATGGLAFILTLIFQCTPVSYAWTFWDGQHQGRCINRNGGTWAHSSVNIVLDIVILLIPLIQLHRLHTSYSLRKKLQIMFMFSVGIIVTIVSALRMQSLIVFMQSQNFTWNNLGIAEWSVVEVHVGIICACLPSARVFFGRIVPKMLGVSSNGSAHGARGYAERQHRSAHDQSEGRRSSTMGINPRPELLKRPINIMELEDFEDNESLHEGSAGPSKGMV